MSGWFRGKLKVQRLLAFRAYVIVSENFKRGETNTIFFFLFQARSEYKKSLASENISGQL